MTKPLSIEELLKLARSASARVMMERDGAREKAVKAVRELEGKVQDAISGDVLRGLSNVAGDMGVLHAARLSGKMPFGIDAFLSRDGRESPCLSKEGVLIVASLHPEDGVLTRLLHDDEVLAEHAEPIARAVQEVLERHIARTERRATSYARASALAAKLSSAMGFAFR